MGLVGTAQGLVVAAQGWQVAGQTEAANPKLCLGENLTSCPVLSSQSTLTLVMVKTTERNSHFPSFFISPVMVWPFKIVVSSLWSHGTTFKLKGGQMQQGHGYKSSSSCSGMVSTREQRPGPRPQRHRLRECRQWIYQSIGPKTVRKPTCSFPWQMGSKGE